MFGNAEVEKHKFYSHKKPILIDDVDIDKILVSNKISIGKKDFKYFVGYKDNENVKLLCIILSKMSGYAKSFNEPKHLSFLIKYDELPEKYNKIWDKVSNSIKKGFDSEPVYYGKYLKIKMQSYEGEISTMIHDDGISKESSHCVYLLVILIDSVFKIIKNYYRQVFLEECK